MKTEIACYACGTAVVVSKHKVSRQKRFATAVLFLFIGSLAITVASLFVAALPFTKCAIASVILLFVKSSADQMAEKVDD